MINGKDDETSSCDIIEKDITLPSGKSAQVIIGTPKTQKNKREGAVDDSLLPPLVFLHGSFHAAWCWKEHFLPYFCSKGYPVVAFSWRGTNGTPAPDRVKKVKVSQHVEDLQGLLDQLSEILGQALQEKKPSWAKPILLSHSMGSTYVMKFLESTVVKPSDLLSGCVTMCSFPPSGLFKMTMRTFWQSPFQVWKIIKGVPMKQVTTDPVLCREIFFGGEPKVLEDGTIDDHGVSDDDLARYQKYFAEDSEVTIDMFDFTRVLPSKKTDYSGRAPFVSDLPPCLVIGARHDFMVDMEANIETAKYFCQNEPIIVDSPHDVMLCRNWKATADIVSSFLETIKNTKC